MRPLFRIAAITAVAAFVAVPLIPDAHAQTAAGINAANNATSSQDTGQGNSRGLHLNRKRVTRRGTVAGPGSAQLPRGNTGEATSAGTAGQGGGNAGTGSGGAGGSNSTH